MRITISIILVLLARLSFAQDLSGIWRGSFQSSDKVLKMANIEDRYKLEVQIDQTDKTLTGVTYSYKTTVFYGKAVASGTVNTKTGKLMLEELKIVEVKMMENSYACVMTYFLQYTKNGNEEFLEGVYSSYGEKDSLSCGKGKVYLRKVTTSDFYREPFLVRKEKEKEMNKKKVAAVPDKPVVSPPIAKNTAPVQKPKPGTTNPPGTKTVPGQNKVSPPVAKLTPPVNKPAPKAVAKPPAKTAIAKNDPVEPKPLKNKPLTDIGKEDSAKNDDPITKKPAIAVNIPKPLATRENELIKTIIVNSKEVSINIYDNGTIDGDTVSVYLDKKLVISRQMLTTQPISLKFELDENKDVHELVMVAENLGTIPPNTSLMVVKAGDKQYEVRITSTEQKNAVVIFKFEKP